MTADAEQAARDAYREAAHAATARKRRNRTFPLRVRLQHGHAVHAGWTDRLYIDGAGLTSCLVPFEPGDEKLAPETPVTCAGCLRRKSVKEAGL